MSSSAGGRPAPTLMPALPHVRGKAKRITMEEVMDKYGIVTEGELRRREEQAKHQAMLRDSSLGAGAAGRGAGSSGSCGGNRAAGAGSPPPQQQVSSISQTTWQANLDRWYRRQCSSVADRALAAVVVIHASMKRSATLQVRAPPAAHGRCAFSLQFEA